MKNSIIVIIFCLASFFKVQGQCICKLEESKIQCSQGAPVPADCPEGAQREVQVKLKNGQTSQLFNLDAYKPMFFVSPANETVLADIGEIKLSECNKPISTSTGIVCQLPVINAPVPATE